MSMNNNKKPQAIVGSQHISPRFTQRQSDGEIIWGTGRVPRPRPFPRGLKQKAYTAEAVRARITRRLERLAEKEAKAEHKVRTLKAKIASFPRTRRGVE